MKKEGEQVAWVTAYDFPIIKIVDKYGGPKKINDLARKNGKIAT